MNILVKAALVAFGLAASATTCSNLAHAGGLADTAESVYKLSIGGKLMDVDATAGMCSAVAVSPTQMVTAAHCVTNWPELDLLVRVDKTDASLTITSSTFKYLTVVRTLSDQDTALVELLDGTEPFKTYATICTEYTPTFGDEMYAIGFPRADKKMVTKGMFGSWSKLEELGLKGPFYKTSVPIIGGNSGGGLFIHDGNDLCLVGTASASYPYSFESYFAPLENVKEAVKNLLVFTAKPESVIDNDGKVKDLKADSWSIDLR